MLTARNATEALGVMAAQRPQLAIVDLRLEPENVEQSIDVNEADSVDGLVLFRRMRQLEPLLPVMILTAHGSIPDAVEATREGVAAFLSKPFDGRTLVDEVKRLLHLHGSRPRSTPTGARASSRATGRCSRWSTRSRASRRPTPRCS